MYNILHITAHMGGGVGRTLSDMCLFYKNNNKYTHKILCIEEPKNRHFIDICKDNNIEIIISEDYDVLTSEIQKADIVQISWWHHPKLAKYIANFPKVPTRLIIWSHISGCTYPSIPYEFLTKANAIFFTSRYSYDNPFFTKEQKSYILNNSEIIYGCADMSSFENKHLKQISNKKTFNIGYIGTLDYSKLYPNFVRLCSKIKIPNVKFVLVGDDSYNKNLIIEEAKKYGIDNKFVFKGYVTDVYSELKEMDVFGYPLNSYHFGTSENSILEAMASELPVIAFNQCAEKYIIKHMETGLLANDEDDYAKYVEYLYENPNEISRIGYNSKKYVLDEFSAIKKMKKLENTYDKVLLENKHVFEFESVFGSNSTDWFLTCLGKDYDFFNKLYGLFLENKYYELDKLKEQLKNCENILRGQSKSSINHFAEYYKDNDFIEYLKSNC